jgi:hypothetical protein
VLVISFAMIDTLPPDGTCVQPFAANAALTASLILGINRGSRVLTLSHE